MCSQKLKPGVTHITNTVMMLKSAWGKSEDSSVRGMNTGDAKWQGDFKTTLVVCCLIFGLLSVRNWHVCAWRDHFRFMSV